MKQFKTRALTLAIATLLSTSAAAEKYELTEIVAPTSAITTFPGKVNDNGMMTVQSRFTKDAEIDFTLLNDGTRALAGIPEDFDPATDTLTEAQYNALMELLIDRVNGDLSDLRIATDFAGSYDGALFSFPALLNTDGDLASSQLNSADHVFLGLNNNNVRVGWGSAPYTRYDYTYQPEAGEGEATPDPVTVNLARRDYTSRALWYDGNQVKTIAPPEQSHLGGESGLFDINDTNLAVGYASVGIYPNAQERVDACIEEDSAASSRPVYTCIWNWWYAYQREAALGGLVTANGSMYDMHAAVWQLDANGDVISETLYPPLATRGEEDLAYMSAYAYAVNNNGIAVGQSWTYYQDVQQAGNRIKMPALYMNNETKAMTTDETYVWGSATAINDNDIATGFVMRTIQGFRRATGFTYDVNTETFTELPGFFNGSGTYPAAINNNGIIVGQGEIDYTLNSQRRHVGFMYDLNNPEAGFIDLNKAIDCTAEYFITSAEDINDSDEIIATGVKVVETTDENGAAVTENQVVMLKLTPTAGDALACSEGNDEVIKREGGSTSPAGLIAMFLIGGLITVRRFIKG